MTRAGLVTSQGDQATRSNVARTRFGIDGSGIAVGVLSDSFNCLGGAAADVANGDLLPVSVVQEDPACSSGTDEGRAMLQIVHDLAPGASLLFATADNGIASFAQNIQTLASLGTKVIVDDIIYFSEPMFQDGIIAQAVDNVAATGVAYFSAAGNDARNAYSSAFRPGIGFSAGRFPVCSWRPVFFGGTAHDFDPGPGTDVFQRITLPNGAGFIMSFQWDSPAASVSPGAPGSPNDLDVYVFNAAGTQVVAGSALDNINGDPIEVFSFVNNTGVTADFNIMITNFQGANPGLMKYVLSGFGGTIQEFATNSGTIYGHTNANGAEAVGAAAYFQTPAFGVSPPVLEPYSSSGTTPVLFDLAATGSRRPIPERTNRGLRRRTASTQPFSLLGWISSRTDSRTFAEHLLRRPMRRRWLPCFCRRDRPCPRSNYMEACKILRSVWVHPDSITTADSALFRQTRRWRPLWKQPPLTLMVTVGVTSVFTATVHGLFFAPRMGG